MYTVKASRLAAVIHATKINDQGDAVAIPLCQETQTEPFGILERDVHTPNCPACLAMIETKLDKATEQLLAAPPSEYRRRKHEMQVLVGRFRQVEELLRARQTTNRTLIGA